MTQALSSGYTVGERLGEGTLGTVYLSATADSGPDRAVKLLRPEFALDPTIRPRFAEAGPLMTALRSPNLVAVENVAVDESEIAIVMELVTGGNLRAYFDLHGAQTELTAMQATHQVLRGLATVHGHGVAHGDVRPENVLLASTPGAPGMTPKLTDFAVARLVRGSAATTADDVYACGQMLYEFVAGEAPSWPLTRPESPEPMGDSLWSLISRWLSLDPAERPLDAWEALAELDIALDSAVDADPAAQAYEPAGKEGGDQPRLRSIGDGFGFTVPVRPPVVLPVPATRDLVSVGAVAVTPAAVTAPSTALVLVGKTKPATLTGSAVVLATPPELEVLDITDDVIDVTDLENALSNWPGPILGFDAPLTSGAGKRRTRRRRMIAFGAVGVMLAGAIAGAAVALTNGHDSTTRYSLSFPAETFPQSGVTLNRTWTVIGGKHPVLHGELVFLTTEASAGPITVAEVLPKIPGSGHATFHPEPKAVDPGQVVTYSLPGVAGLYVADSYDIPINDSDVSMATLERWAAEQSAEAGSLFRYAHPQLHLARLALTPAVARLAVGKTVALSLRGVESNGTPAATVALGGARYQVADPRIAKVSSTGVVTGVKAGRTAVRATLGKLVGTAVITVTAAAHAKDVSAETPVAFASPLNSTLTGAGVSLQPGAVTVAAFGNGGTAGTSNAGNTHTSTTTTTTPVGGTTPPAGGTTPGGTTPPAGGTTPPAGGGTTPPAGGGTTPPAGGGTTPPAGGGTTPPAGGGTTPPAGGGTTPPAGGTTPPAGGGTTPPAGGTTPPAGGTTPPAGGTTPPAGGGVTPVTPVTPVDPAPVDPVTPVDPAPVVGP